MRSTPKTIPTVASVKPKLPSSRDEVVAMADAGNLNGVINALASELSMNFIGDEKSELLRRAIKARADSGGPANVIEAVLGQMIAFDAELLLWCQTRVRKEITHDANRGLFDAGPSEGIVTEELPRLSRIEDRLITLAKAYSTIQHTLALSQPTGREQNRSNIIQMPSVKAAEAAHG